MQASVKVTLIKGSFETVKSELLALPLTAQEARAKQGILPTLNRMLAGIVTEALRRGDFKGKDKDAVLLPIFTDFAHKNLLLLGFEGGNGSTFAQVNAYRKLGSSLFRHAQRGGVTKITLAAEPLDLQHEAFLEALVEGFVLAGYTFNYYKSKRPSDPKSYTLTIVSARNLSRTAVDTALRMSMGAMLARDLINTPPRDCTPRYLVAQSRAVAKKGGLRIEVFDRKRLKKLGANALLAVSQGSEEPPFLIKMTYRPRSKAKRIISLIGKGITFDSGGLSIKTGSGMETMKYDMSGAAAVIGAMHTIAALKPSVEVRAYIPTTENMINGRATRPGDVVTAVNGKTIEILNTDAEGRLILADALSLAERDGCDVMVDLATLTGACVVALGTHYAGLFTDDDELATALQKAGDLSGEQLWRLPLAPEYRDLIKSPIADIKNTGGRWGGAITAALFLKEFVATTPWAHLDIAGPAFAEGEEHHVKRGGVGFAVRTLARFVGALETRRR
jgi:leucyl aminopeptidase